MIGALCPSGRPSAPERVAEQAAHNSAWVQPLRFKYVVFSSSVAAASSPVTARRVNDRRRTVKVTQ